MSKNRKKAVALRYPQNAPAPFITARGQGLIAEEILKCAKEHDIMITEDSQLTEFLSIQEIGTVIPEETWEVVAQIFTFISKSQEKNYGKN